MYLLTPNISKNLYTKKTPALPAGTIIFDTRSAVPVSGETTITNQSFSGVWPAFLNNYGVWGTNSTTFNATYSLNVTVPGTYQVELCADNSGEVFIDNVSVLTHNQWSYTVTKNVTLSSGMRSLRISGFNEGGPMAIAVTIKFL